MTHSHNYTMSWGGWGRSVVNSNPSDHVWLMGEQYHLVLRIRQIVLSELVKSPPLIRSGDGTPQVRHHPGLGFLHLLAFACSPMFSSFSLGSEKQANASVRSTPNLGDGSVGLVVIGRRTLVPHHEGSGPPAMGRAQQPPMGRARPPLQTGLVKTYAIGIENE